MMKLYFSPGACSLAPHIVLEETGTPYEAEKVDLKAKTTATGTDFRQVNPRGQVPTLRMANGEILTEGPVIMQYIADQKGDGQLVPRAGTTERYRVMEWMNFTTSEIHKTYGVIFGADRDYAPVADGVKTAARELLSKKLDWVDAQLAGKEWLTGKTFTAADAYLFTCWNWNQYVGVDGSRWKNINAWASRVYARPAVQRAMKAEGLLK